MSGASRLDPVLRYREILQSRTEVALEQARAQLESVKKRMVELDTERKNGLSRLEEEGISLEWKVVCYEFLYSLSSRLEGEKVRFEEALRIFENCRTVWDSASREKKKILLLIEEESREQRRSERVREERCLDDSETLRWSRSKWNGGGNA
ncbi:MAG: flagellar export protein FliJ [Leptospirales bacterium]